ncbi:MAG: ethanolamine utilization phosphate acetyltransferase EutD [Cellulosilyticaceae bacterium]
MENFINDIVDEVIRRVKKEVFIEVEASGRHVHLTREAIDTLFGKGYKLTKVKDLSQPGQYACKERVTLIGPKGQLQNVVVLGPERSESQVEVSLTDALALGVKPEVRQSGDLNGTNGITLATNMGQITLKQGLVAAKRHIHITPEDASKFGVHDGEVVQTRIYGTRPLIFDDVIVRVSSNFATFMHIDYDEANACGFSSGTFAKIIK